MATRPSGYLESSIPSCVFEAYCHLPYHHYVSAFHLAEFTVDRRRNAKIHVLDLQRRQQWLAPVGRAGGERDYNATHGVPNLAPEAIEQLLARYEDAAAPVLRAVNDTRRLPSGDSLWALLDYVALLTVNNPARRSAMNDSQDRALYYMAHAMIASPETFQAAQTECRRDGVPILGNVSYEELCALLERNSFTYTMDPIAHLRGMGNRLHHLAALLRQRTWLLLIAPPGAPDLICGDHPVVLTWTVERRRELKAAARGQPTFPPGYAMRDTELIVPLGRRVGLLGVFGGQSRRLLADERVVAEINGRILGHATRFVYAADATFTFRDGRNELRDSSVLLSSPFALEEPESRDP